MSARNWLVEVHDVVANGDEFTQYGPYTEAAARKVEAAIQKLIDESVHESEELNVNAYPIKKWDRGERAGFREAYCYKDDPEPSESRGHDWVNS